MSNTELGRVTRETSSQVAVSRLRHDIVVGQLRPGTKLKVEELQVAYGLSNSPLREALNQLAQEGLVRADARRGFRVAEVSGTDFIDIVRLRTAIDLPAFAESIARGDDAWESEVVAAFYLLEKVETRLNDEPDSLNNEWAGLHKSFHMSLISRCTSMRTLAWSSSLFDQADRYRRISASHRPVPRRKDREHQAIMEAALRRDAETACAMLRAHIEQTQERVLEALASIRA